MSLKIYSLKALPKNKKMFFWMPIKLKKLK